MTDKIELKPCPFCGYDAYSQIRVKRGMANDCILVRIKCKNCDAYQESIAESGISIEAMQEMIARVANYWNRRCQALPELSGGEAS